MNIGKPALPHNFVVKNEGSVLPQCHSYLYIIQIIKKKKTTSKLKDFMCYEVIH